MATAEAVGRLRSCRQIARAPDRPDVSLRLLRRPKSDQEWSVRMTCESFARRAFSFCWTAQRWHPESCLRPAALALWSRRRPQFGETRSDRRGLALVIQSPTFQLALQSEPNFRLPLSSLRHCEQPAPQLIAS